MCEYPGGIAAQLSIVNRKGKRTLFRKKNNKQNDRIPLVTSKGACQHQLEKPPSFRKF
jgi:hypothetical protein